MTDTLSHGAVAPADIEQWLKSEPAVSGDFAADGASFTKFWSRASQLLGRLPQPAQRQDSDRKTARSILEAARKSRVNFLRRHVDAIYDELDGQAHAFREDQRAGRRRRAEISRPGAVAGGHRRGGGASPEPEGGARDRPGAVHLGGAAQRALGAAFLPRHAAAARSGADGCCRNSSKTATSSCPARPSTATARAPSSPSAIRASSTPRTRPRWPAWRPASISLCSTTRSRSRCCAACRSSIRNTRTGTCSARASTSRISITAAFRFSGISNAISATSTSSIAGWRSPDDAPPDEFGGQTVEKPWIAAVEAFAIGGHCQILLAVDYVLAEKTAYLTLPGAQGGHHPRRCQHAASPRGRRPHRAAGDPVREAARMRQRRRGG